METPNTVAADNSPAAILRRVPLFQDLDAASLEELLRHCRRRAYRSRTVLFEEGDPGHTLFVILRGAAVIQKISPDTGAPIFLAERRAGECFGEMALFDASPRSASAIAQRGSEMLLLGQEDFLQCVRHHPEVALAVIRTLSARLRDAADQAMRHAGLDVMGRLAAYLLENAVPLAAANTDGARPAARRHLCPRPSDREIGERIATTRESVSRKLTHLVRLRAVARTPDAIILLDEARLASLCGGAAPVERAGKG
jgi:CRP-like cAMP-binding protein